MKSSESHSLSETQRLWLEFWTLFTHQLEATPGHPLACRTPQPRHWLSWGTGHGVSFIGVRGRTDEGWLGVNLWIDTGDRATSKALFDQLSLRSAAIEAELAPTNDERLEWHRKERARSSELLLRRDWDLLARECWPDAVDWLVLRVVEFERALAPELAALR